MKNGLLFFAAVGFAIGTMTGCAAPEKDFRAKDPDDDRARIIVYWPHQWQSQWARYEISFNGIPFREVKDGGYVESLVPPGAVELKSRHFQDRNYYVLIQLAAQKKRNYYFKIDTQPEDVTLASVVGGVLSIATVVNGVKSQASMNQTGQASWSDVKNVAAYRGQQAETAEKARPIGYHVDRKSVV